MAFSFVYEQNIRLRISTNFIIKKVAFIILFKVVKKTILKQFMLCIKSGRIKGGESSRDYR